MDFSWAMGSTAASEFTLAYLQCTAGVLIREQAAGMARAEALVAFPHRSDPAKMINTPVTVYPIMLRELRSRLANAV